MQISTLKLALELAIAHSSGPQLEELQITLSKLEPIHKRITADPVSTEVTVVDGYALFSLLMECTYNDMDRICTEHIKSGERPCYNLVKEEYRDACRHNHFGFATLTNDQLDDCGRTLVDLWYDNNGGMLEEVDDGQD